MGQGGLKGCNRNRDPERGMNGLTLPVLTGHTGNLLRLQDPSWKRAETRLRVSTGSLSLGQLHLPCVSSAPSTPGAARRHPDWARGRSGESHRGPRKEHRCCSSCLIGEAISHSVWGLGLHRRPKRKS